jgi:hypothetical protein
MSMPRECECDSCAEFARAELRQAVMTAFNNVLHATHLSPMAVMSLTAAAVGSVYKEVADAHCGGNACPCGWQPNRHADVEVLRAALAMTTEIFSVSDLHVVQAAGRA